jgi:hypothetical protein
MTTLGIGLSPEPSRNDIQFHLSIPVAIRSLGVSAKQCSSKILSATEIARFNDVTQEVHNTSLQTVWRIIHPQINAHPEPEEIPGVDAQAGEIRNWMPAHQSLLQTLRNLDLRRVNLGCVPLEIGLCTKLQMFTSNHNPVSALPEELFSGLVDLRYLNFWSNPLQSLPERLFEGLNHLCVLSFYNCALSSLPERVFQGLDCLEELSLNGNRLISLSGRLFHGLNQLRLLYLHDNRLCSLPEGLFRNLERLELLHLYDNQLTSLPERLFQGPTRLSELVLFWGNPRLLVIWKDFQRYEHGLSQLESVRSFFNYACQSSLAKLYQRTAGEDSLDAIRAAFHRLPDTVKNALYRGVWREAGEPITEDAQWGEHHTFDDRQIFNAALKEYVREYLNRDATSVAHACNNVLQAIDTTILGYAAIGQGRI